MQTSICYTGRDRWLLDKVRRKAEVERRSVSSVILGILERYFIRGRKLGEILQDMDHLSPENLTEALEIQEEEDRKRFLGEILLTETFVKEKDLQNALIVQKHISPN